MIKYLPAMRLEYSRHDILWSSWTRLMTVSRLLSIVYYSTVYAYACGPF